MNAHYYRWGILWFSRGLLWLVALLAAVGATEKKTPSLSNENVLLALFFVAVVLLLYFLAETKNEKKWHVKGNEFRLSLIPALVTGLVFPILWFPVYCLGLLWFVYGIVPVCKKWRSRFRQPKITVSEMPAEPNDDTEEEFLDDSITQQIVRRRTESGSEQVEGTFVIQFSEQELTKTLHVPFCPAFASLPNIETFLLDGESCKINLVKPQPFGVRVDVKRTSRSPEQVRIAVVASE